MIALKRSCQLKCTSEVTRALKYSRKLKIRFTEKPYLWPDWMKTNMKTPVSVHPLSCRFKEYLNRTCQPKTNEGAVALLPKFPSTFECSNSWEYVIENASLMLFVIDLSPSEILQEYHFNRFES